MNFCQTSSVFSDPLDLLDHPLLLDIFFLGAPQLRAGVGFYFFTKCPLRNTLMGAGERTGEIEAVFKLNN